MSNQTEQYLLLCVLHNYYFDYYIPTRRAGDFTIVNESMANVIYEIEQYHYNHEKCEHKKKFYLDMCKQIKNTSIFSVKIK